MLQGEDWPDGRLFGEHLTRVGTDFGGFRRRNRFFEWGRRQYRPFSVPNANHLFPPIVCLRQRAGCAEPPQRARVPLVCPLQIDQSPTTIPAEPPRPAMRGGDGPILSVLQCRDEQMAGYQLSKKNRGVVLRHPCSSYLPNDQAFPHHAVAGTGSAASLFEAVGRSAVRRVPEGGAMRRPGGARRNEVMPACPLHRGLREAVRV